MAPREEESVLTSFTIPTNVSIAIKDTGISASVVPLPDMSTKVVVDPNEDLHDVDPEDRVRSLLDTVSEVIVSQPISQVVLQLAEGGLYKVGPLLEKAGVGSGMVKDVQRTARRLRRAGVRSGAEGGKLIGKTILKLADFLGVNFMLGFSGLRLQTMGSDINKVVYSYDSDIEESFADLLKEDLLEDCDSEEDPDYIPSGEDEKSSNGECSTEDDMEDELISGDDLEDAIVPVVVRHEMGSPEAVCKDIERGDVIFEEGYCVPMIIKTEPVEVEETDVNPENLNNLASDVDSLLANIESLTIEDTVRAQDQVTSSPAIVVEEIVPVSARISTLERTMEIEKSPRLSKSKIAQENVYHSDERMFPNEVDSEELSNNVDDLDEIIDNNSSVSSVEEIMENIEKSPRLSQSKIAQENVDHSDVKMIPNEVDSDELSNVDDLDDIIDVKNSSVSSVEEIIENIIDSVTPACSTMEFNSVPETGSDSEFD